MDGLDGSALFFFNVYGFIFNELHPVYILSNLFLYLFCTSLNSVLKFGTVEVPVKRCFGTCFSPHAHGVKSVSTLLEKSLHFLFAEVFGRSLTLSKDPRWDSDRGQKH